MHPSALRRVPSRDSPRFLREVFVKIFLYQQGTVFFRWCIVKYKLIERICKGGVRNWNHFLYMHIFLRSHKAFTQLLNLFLRPTERQQSGLIRSAILDLRPVPSRRFDDAQPLTALLDGLITDIKGCGDGSHWFTPNCQKQILGIDLKLPLPWDTAEYRTGHASGDMRCADRNRITADSAINSYRHNDLAFKFHLSKRKGRPSLCGRPFIGGFGSRASWQE